MRTRFIGMALLAAGLLTSGGCKSKPDAAKTNPSATASAEGVANAQAELSARIGGQLVPVGDHTVEVRLMKHGTVDALVYDAKKEPVADPSKVSLTVHANATGDAHPAIKCGWEHETARFSGRADGDAELAPGPVEVELDSGGGSARGKLETPVLLVGPVEGGALFVAGKYGIELTAGANGRVEALVRDAAGVRVTGTAKEKFEVELTGADGKLHAVALTWNAARARFVGEVAADAKLAAGPAEIQIDGEVAAKLPRLALRAEAKHGGHVIVVGDYSVELVAKGDTVAAYAFDASGEAYAKGDLDLELRAGSAAFVKLAWDAPSLSYQAKLEAALDLDVEPIVLAIDVGGKAFVGAYARADAELDAKAKLEAKADVKGSAKANASAKASLKAPSVKVTPPKVGVKVNKSAGASAKAGFSFGTR